MRHLLTVFSGGLSHAIIAAAYIVCHGLTAMVVTPVQNMFLPEITIFASLAYLPHGVRVLAIWLFGWRACLSLAVGTLVADAMFTSANIREMLEPLLLKSVAVGVLSSLAAFELLRLSGRNFYSGQARRMSWAGVLTVGAMASLLNSLGQSMVFSGVIFPDDQLTVLTVYAVGDMIGLMLCMFGLMLIFRWMRLRQETLRDRDR